jgi:hypothetical protein
MPTMQLVAAAVDLIKTLAWPFVVIWGVWYLRDETKNGAKRLTEIGFSGAKFAPPEQMTTQQSSTILTASTSLERIGGDATGQQSLSSWIGKLKASISEDQLEPAVERTKAELVALVGPNSSDQTQALLYLAAALNIQLHHERNYSAIFGSQLSLLAQANAAGGAIPDMAKSLYEAAKRNTPMLYNNYTFEQWIAFLVESGLIEVDARGNYLLTNYGRGFLRYIVDRRLSVNKPN